MEILILSKLLTPRKHIHIHNVVKILHKLVLLLNFVKHLKTKLILILAFMANGGVMPQQPMMGQPMQQQQQMPAATAAQPAKSGNDVNKIILHKF